MKIKQLIAEVEALGMTVETTNGVYVVLEGQTLARVNKQEEYSIDTDYKNFHKLDKETKNIIFHILYDYACTPSEERGKEKRNYIKCVHESVAPESYINLDIEGNSIRFANKESLIYKTKFTDSEIRRYKLQKFVDSELFELVEVMTDLQENGE